MELLFQPPVQPLVQLQMKSLMWLLVKLPMETRLKLVELLIQHLMLLLVKPLLELLEKQLVQLLVEPPLKLMELPVRLLLEHLMELLVKLLVQLLAELPTVLPVKHQILLRVEHSIKLLKELLMELLLKVLVLVLVEFLVKLPVKLVVRHQSRQLRPTLERRTGMARLRRRTECWRKQRRRRSIESRELLLWRRVRFIC